MMSDVKKNSIGVLLKELLKQRSLSMRKLSKLTEIDIATISRIINGKRKATPEHLQKFANCLKAPIADLLLAASYPIEQKQENLHSDDFHSSIDSILNILESSKIYNKKFTIESVEQQLAKYTQFAQTEVGKETILKGFEEKLQKVDGIGPFIDHLKDMFVKFSTMKSTPRELALMGGALIYFILPIDIIPDYIFPIGYLDDAIVVNLVLDLLSKEVKAQ
ncbi:DUF1232 domain-containing protein [Neobacillus ginsengisoli]|uniref:Uncharacterized membrane protein YkvA (DUF1232 family)/plasmid maintenance system antidote protein VapI n=1 Tax=Neobacillus ginsengisoli TaxID=904295 RepID=A0ABT9Y1F8_9BACI|nr:DUF1232 domain-containing protein [Neobacillus ginsengisoli]MDQ0201667.1 uncharacterized membrane protein YkvA (DUF1232 family)/plasmid maintenance system antidote protein VapI [Neobacillus ginsengisoli]